MEEKVLLALKSASSPMKLGELAEVLGIDKKDVDKAIKSLVSKDLAESPKRCFYAAK